MTFEEWFKKNEIVGYNRTEREAMKQVWDAAHDEGYKEGRDSGYEEGYSSAEFRFSDRDDYDK